MGYSLIFLTINAMKAGTMFVYSLQCHQHIAQHLAHKTLHYKKLVMCMGNTLCVPMMPRKVRRDNFLGNNSCTQSPGSAAKCIFPYPIKCPVIT